MRTLVVNAGSSSLKLSLLGDGDQLVASSELTAHGGEFDAQEVGRQPCRFCPGHPLGPVVL